MSRRRRSSGSISQTAIGAYIGQNTSAYHRNSVVKLAELGPFDVKVSAVDNYNRWEQLYGANPEAVALIGLCAPDVTSLGKLNAANGDKFVAGGYDLTELNLKAVKEGHAYVTIGQSAER